MKALDTPILLELLRGRPGAKGLLKHLQGEELATTELNLFELEVICRSEGGPALERRIAALERLRRKITVLPIDERATRSAVARSGSGLGRLPGSASLMLGAVEASGCTEWITTETGRPPRAPGRRSLRVVCL